ncbi:MAG: hypothetical protein NTZ17_20405 [Phycisphaerae bacterium]|nr:hypothetical protein [Phycisphaerae bacterium]
MMTAISSRIKPPVAARPSPAPPLADHLAGCWLLNEGAGQVVRDISGQRHDGSFSGHPAWTPGAFGPAVEFDGNDDWIGMGNCLNLGTDDVTLLALVQYGPADQPEQWQGDHIAAIAGKGYLTPSGGYGLSIGAGNKICWQVRNQSTVFNVASDSTLNDGLWHVAVAVCDRDSATGMRLYIDGVRQSATADPTSVAGIDVTDPAAFAIGSRQDTSMVWAWDFLGRVAAVCVWKCVLTEAQIGQLQREPFALFARRRALACFTFPAGTIVDLASSAHGVSSASATLQIIRGLSGVSAAHATATAVLRKAGSVTLPGARPRLRDALFNGMTSTAFKLGTILTQGWFWACRRGGTAIYRGPSITQVDFNHILQVADPQSKEIVLPVHLSHPPGSTHCYLVQRFNGCGDQERTTAAAVMVRIGPDGQLARPAPNAVLVLQGQRTGGRRLRLTWFYPPLDQEVAPQEFHVYWDSGAGPLDLEHRRATVPYEGCRFYQWETEPLGDSPYTFAVCSCGVNHVESMSLVSVVCPRTDLAPEAPTILGAGAV